MINLITSCDSEYAFVKDLDNVSLCTNIQNFIKWVRNQDILQLDVETLFVPDSADAINERELVALQIGATLQSDRWVFDYSALQDDSIKTVLKDILEDPTNVFIAHNAVFEYKTIKRWLDITLDNIHDTFLMSKILNTGLDLEKGYHSLAGAVNRFFGINMDKGAQTTFTKDPLTFEQIYYAADDVLYLTDLFFKLKELLVNWDLWFLYDRVEREVMKVYGDMEITPMRFDMEHWDKLILSLEKDDDAALEKLNKIVFKDPELVDYLKTSNMTLGIYLIQPRDKVMISWSSNITRQKILLKIIPDLISVPKFTKPELKKFHKSGVLTSKENKLLNLYINRDFTKLNRYLRLFYKDWLYENKFFLKKDDILINWNSSIHKLYVFQFYYPHFENTNAKTLARIYTNELINQFKKYVKIHKSRTTYGAKFKYKYVRKDNTIALSNIKQVLATGRIAGSILLQMPQEARFRNAFLPSYEDWIFVDSDYASAEVAIMSYASGESVFLEAIRSGEDAHMKSAALIFKDRWEGLAEDTCSQLIDGSRCSCAEHEKLRKISKAITFGLA